MDAMDEYLSEVMLEPQKLRLVEPHIYTIVKDEQIANEYDTRFGSMYDWVACNPIYNRVMWGYSIAKFASFTQEALTATLQGSVLDLGCGSLAFTAQTYAHYTNRPVVLLDQSLKMLKIAKSRLLKLHKTIPENISFLHADACDLPFREHSFNTVIALNLLHCIDDVKDLVADLKNIVSKGGRMYFTTLLNTGRFTDRYLKALANADKLVPRDMNQLCAYFDELRLPIEHEINGNMAFIHSAR